MAKKADPKAKDENVKKKSDKPNEKAAPEKTAKKDSAKKADTKAKKDSGKKNASAKSKNSKDDKKKGGIKKYFRDLKSEIKKVVWPSREKVTNNTGVVLAVMIICAAGLFGVDSLLALAINALLSIGTGA